MTSLGGEFVMETASGRAIDLRCPQPADIAIGDIAHHLAQANRYAGATSFGDFCRPISVAEHAVIVAHRLMAQSYPARVILAGLHHDDAEAYLGDISRPLKALIPAYQRIEEDFAAVIAEALELPPITQNEKLAVKLADDWALSMEAHWLMPSKGRGWFSEGKYQPQKQHEIDMHPAVASPDKHRRRFLDLHYSLSSRLGVEAA